MNAIEIKIQEAAKKVLNKTAVNIKEHNSGAYSEVYKANCDKTGMEIVIKVYFKNGFMRQEIRELEELRKYSTVPVPQIYGYHIGDDFLNDTFFMEAMPGETVRYIE